MAQESLGKSCQACGAPSFAVHYGHTQDAEPTYYCRACEPPLPDKMTLRFTADQIPTGAGTLMFRGDDVQVLLDSGLPIEWAKDTGTYLGVWGDKGVLHQAMAYTVDGFCLDDNIRYQDDPELFDKVWGTTQDICGGDDFGEPISSIPPRPPNAEWLVMEVTEEAVTLQWA